MYSQVNSFGVVTMAVALGWASRVLAVCPQCPLDLSRPACGKVCKLVCETKTIVAIGYGSTCKDICLPPPSRPGCKHCAVCCGECKCDPCTCCQDAAPKVEFCWRDWLACGCARPRSVRVLTKYQAEKKICWYHWEVVDAPCCNWEAVGEIEDDGMGIVRADETGAYYKQAPEDAAVGDTLPVSPEEMVKLAAVLAPEPHEQAGESPSDPAAIASADGAAPADAPIAPTPKSRDRSLAKLFQSLQKD